ncbi:MAG TPA: ATP synthase F1 subunit delta [Verrucomicrobiae bacterium]|nr:ATP synthase F1 subunit delta [Verrucomicrobiae bacterium]
MLSEKLARRYATAVFSAAGDAGAVDDVGAGLATISSAIAADVRSREFFLSPVIDRGDKERLLLAAFAGKVHDVALHTLLLLVRKRREPLLDVLLAEYRKLSSAARGAEPLTVTSARELSAEQERELVARLERIYGKSFTVTQVVDPRAIGGIRIAMGDRVIDGTISGQLDALSRTLFAPT